MNNPQLCDVCGTLFAPKPSLKGQCPACMLMGAFPDVAAASGDSSGISGSAWFEPPSTDELQPHFKDFEILSLAGRGGMSAVYKARQTNLDRVVAIKILPVEVAESLGGIKRFQREAKALAQVSHPNIVAIYSFGETGRWCYFVMEYIDGCSLRQIMGSGDLEDSDVLRIVQSICTSLQYAHDQGIVHRDIKPENVLLDRHGNVKLVDFGLAKPLNSTALSARATGANQVLGTPHYLAPEQMRSPTKVDQRADLYSLGVVIYEMLTGELPMGNFDPPSKTVSRQPGWDQIVMRALATDPSLRYGQANELSEALVSVNNAPAASKPSGQLVEPNSKSVDRSWLIVIVALGLLMGTFYFLDAGVRHLRPDINNNTHVEWGLHDLGRGLLCLVAAVVMARGNLRPITESEIPSTSQRILVSITNLGYWLVSLATVMIPAMLILLYAAIPLLSDREIRNWEIFGYFFRTSESYSPLDDYWLAAFGGAALASGIWSVLIFAVLHFFSRQSERLLQPLASESVRALRISIILIAIFVLIPLGCLLLFAADNQHW